MGFLIAEPMLNSTLAPLNCMDGILVPLLIWLNVLPFFCNETGLSKLVGLGKKAVFFLDQWQLHEASSSTWTTHYYYNISFKRKNSVVSKNREMLLFGGLLTDYFFFVFPKVGNHTWQKNI